MNAPPNPGHRPRRVSFFGHELAEYALALAFLATGLHSSGRTEQELLASGGALLLLGLLSKGRLGAVALIGRRAHRLADVIVAGGLALSPLIDLHHLDAVAVLVAEAAALILAFIARRTRYLDSPRPALKTSEPLASATGLGTSLLPLAGQATRTGARRLGLIAGVTRRVTREHRTGRAGDR